MSWWQVQADKLGRALATLGGSVRAFWARAKLDPSSLRLGARALLAIVGFLVMAWVGASRAQSEARALRMSVPPANDTAARADSLPSAPAATAVGAAALDASADVTSAHARDEPPNDRPASATSRGRATPEDPVVLNRATLEDLRRLPGVGAKRAEAILALREKLGRFRKVEDLLRVRGIGRARLRKLRSLVRLDDQPAAPAAGSSPAQAPAPLVAR
jgi:competence protein ComEA